MSRHLISILHYQVAAGEINNNPLAIAPVCGNACRSLPAQRSERSEIEPRIAATNDCHHLCVHPGKYETGWSGQRRAAL
jgi:hypothetical protein